jgi:integrase
MSRRSLTGGVRPKGSDRIELEFTYRSTRYRPTLARKPTPANLRQAYVKLASVDRAISEGTFDFAREFPNYRLRSRAPKEAREIPREDHRQTCNEIFDAFLRHCQTRVRLGDLAYASLDSYRQILNHVWKPRIGAELFLEVRYSRLQAVLATYVTQTQRGCSGEGSWHAGDPLSKRTYNNIASALRCAFEFGYQDHLDKHNPALRLKTLRLTPKDKDPIDPFTIQEGETIIARAHAEFGEAHGNYEEFRFFTGVRPSEQFALTIADYDRATGILIVRRACVRKHEKDRTKTNEDRKIELCARARAVLERQLVLREQLVHSGRITHDLLFFQADGAPLADLSYPYRRWRYVLQSAGVRYREPYNARHSFISWSVMTGRNLLKLALEDGHRLQTLLSTYAAWAKEARQADVALIQQAMAQAPARVDADRPLRENDAADPAVRRPTERTGGRLSLRRLSPRDPRGAQRNRHHSAQRARSRQSRKELAAQAAPVVTASCQGR